ncbi:ATP synthase subunit delta [Nesterenkonia sp. AN1]|uniref:ATP synthase subunit delta n=1 Tax=Nesterenkonia aurantiaca TaxID=1436010 RepID=A0A4R7G4A9_9MICC|nr:MULTISPECIES: F0F1 ATP synthase subunit delta [Nesterenkonia]EXF24506.1 ATP synthase subunit delta [Nesterenkonia sp. AN1]TDS86149.1 ATP synthase F1 subcomplex delta subunit [Nesterenkonia aurantiaca]
MAAVTTESLAAVQQELAPSLAQADLEVARELFAVLDVLDSSAGLRRSLTDPSRDPQDRVAMARSLFGAKVKATTTEVLDALVSRRWSKERDLGDAVEVLAVVVVVVQAEREGLAGLEKLETALLDFRRTVASSHQVQRALTDAQATGEAKQKLGAQLSPGASAEARLLIDRAVTAPRGLRPSQLVERFTEQIAARQQRWIALVTVAKELDPSYMQRLGASLDRYFGRELKLDVVLDPAVVGGIRVQVGDEVVDSTVATKLNDLNRRLAS